MRATVYAVCAGFIHLSVSSYAGNLGVFWNYFIARASPDGNEEGRGPLMQRADPGTRGRARRTGVATTAALGGLAMRGGKAWQCPRGAWMAMSAGRG
ncbi:hypothetical protein KSP40_PGU022395 [Platanthera guangdongensis]|uniref:Secreted protein n=1 Tax=Platanthera guangdongensis TaxID=2320717 RepID=A0ABR2MQP7_9ASPA